MVEVRGDLTPLLGPAFVRLDAMRIKQLQNATVYHAIDELAALSAQTMNVRAPLTSCDRVIASDHTIYLAWEHDPERDVSRLLGFLKTGRKKLFLYDEAMHTYEGELLCVLDFYVHFGTQRRGIGQKLFEHMLQSERTTPEMLALDNPTVTLLAFVARHYDLARPVWQNTNFVVFPQLFSSILQPRNGGTGNAVVVILPSPAHLFLLSAFQSPTTTRRTTAGADRPRPVASESGSLSRQLPPSPTKESARAFRATETRWLAHAVSGHPARGNAMAAPVDADQSTEGTLANRANQAKARKQHILSSNPLW